jgi:hypothetical protein
MIVLAGLSAAMLSGRCPLWGRTAAPSLGMYQDNPDCLHCEGRLVLYLGDDLRFASFVFGGSDQVTFVEFLQFGQAFLH